MLNRSQIMTLMMLRRREDTIFSLPKEITDLIIHLGDDAYDSDGDIAKLLHYVAYGEPVMVKQLLEKNNRLLFEAGDAVAPSGDILLRVTPYECALAAGDHDMAGIIKPYFSNIGKGEEEEVRQYGRYKPFIEGMLTQKYYNLNELLNILFESNSDDVTAALECDMNYKSKLSAALVKFRVDFSPRVIKEGMVFNYNNLWHALDLYNLHYESLKNSENSYEKCNVFWRQVIGYIQRGLPACDRQAFNHGLNRVVSDGGKLRQRKFEGGFLYGNIKPFPVTAGDTSVSGLGYEEAYSELTLSLGSWRSFSSLWKEYIKLKAGHMKDLCTRNQKTLKY
jgi:hypothetical protein